MPNPEDTTPLNPRNRDWVPQPDPTLLTTQQLAAAISALKELLFTRLDAMDKALSLAHDGLGKVPTDVDRHVAHLRELTEEKFKVVETRFRERDVAFRERDVAVQSAFESRDVAVQAAFAAQKEAVAERNKASDLAISKSEAATAKQIETQGQLIHTATKALEGVIADLKERMTRLESEDRGERTGKTSQQVTQQNSLGVALGLIGTAIGVAGFLAFLLKP